MTDEKNKTQNNLFKVTQQGWTQSKFDPVNMIPKIMFFPLEHFLAQRLTIMEDIPNLDNNLTREK